MYVYCEKPQFVKKLPVFVKISAELTRMHGE
nr:MAG TPA: hypothetical protein [Caudoviricetes sp.]